ncbi:MAG TPA: 4-hydroxybenzoate octaprenyltransferase [Candidatus Acidoferrales bacterium]|nr:4-hydroxybenzoate octaprenyltransferase [Candidatus Acidoferrales bacterium]
MLERTASPLLTVRLFLTEIRIEHTLFALPFAYVGALLAAHGVPALRQLVWITLAVLGARTAAMSANRYFDREIDARNPRTARRALVRGALPPAVMLWGIALGLVLLVVAAAELGPLCLALLPLAAVGIVVYPFCKRFTWATHFVLGAVDGFAPLGAYIAVSGTITAASLALFLAVTLWVAGFDIIYALMDRDVDVAQRIRSIPARFGERSGRLLPIGLHGAMLLLLASAGLLSEAHPLYYLGVGLVALLIWYEHRLLGRSSDVFSLNERVFNANMLFSLAFLVTTAAAAVQP